MADLDDALELLTSGEHQLGLGARRGSFLGMKADEIIEELERRGADDQDVARTLALSALVELDGFRDVVEIESRGLRPGPRRPPTRVEIFYVPADQVD